MTDPFLPGTVIANKYRIGRVLGRGGMGVVVAAEHLHLRERVALKFLLPEVASVPGIADRFLREARAAMRLGGDHVAQVFDADVLEGGTPYMVLEYLEGEDLGALLARRGPLPASEAVGYVLEACEGLAAAHAAGLVHRDLKPSNLFLARGDDGVERVKVLDFGIAKSADAFDGATTATGVMLGSPSYMSPEQLRASTSVDARSDVWALGVVLFELLVGGPPFGGGTLAEMYARILTALPPPPRSLRHDVPTAVDDAVLRCLQKAPPDRFSDVGELARALAHYGDGAAVERARRVERALGARLSPSVRPGSGTEIGPPANVSAVRNAALGPGETTSEGVLTRPWRRRDEPRSGEGEGADEDGEQAPSMGERVRHAASRSRYGRRGRPALVLVLGAIAAVEGAALVYGAARSRAVVAPSPSPASSASLGETLHACDVGDAAACMRAGRVLELGTGVAVDLTRAADLYARACDEHEVEGCAEYAAAMQTGMAYPLWLQDSYLEDKEKQEKAAGLAKRACEGGAAKGCWVLGRAYEQGFGVGEDAARAGDLYQSACERGFARACVDRGRLFAEGIGVTADPTHARDFAQRGCDSGSAEGCAALGELFEKGAGGVRDEARAADLYQRGCDGANPKGCTMLGRLRLRQADGATEATAAGVALLERGCDVAYPDGCAELGVWYRDRGAGDVMRRYLARAKLQKACDGGSPWGCTELAWMSAEGGVPAGKDALEYFERACGALDSADSGVAVLYCDNNRTRACAMPEKRKPFYPACHGAGAMYFAGGEGVKRDRAKAMKLFREACDHDVLRGCSALGSAYETGRGVAKDYARAKELQTRACEGGDAVGCFDLALLYEQGWGVKADRARAVELYRRACDTNDDGHGHVVDDACDAFGRLGGKR